ncbi:MAG: large conductance mechanosensitive channel protein MscL [Phycisphaerales bacterium]|nr:large conductance mechanosensitive channel protein MscL [Phycisphaerales bacterium]
MGFVQEFREFAVKGNVLDLAVGIIMGTAFTKIVNSLINDVIMPPLGYAIGGVDFKNLVFVIRGPVKDAAGVVTAPEVAIRYGAFINTAIEFVIVAFAVFVMVKAMNRVIRKREVVVVKV